eukprot:5264270-Amphidinium_carterae.2
MLSSHAIFTLGKYYFSLFLSASQFANDKSSCIRATSSHKVGSRSCPKPQLKKLELQCNGTILLKP